MSSKESVLALFSDDVSKRRQLVREFVMDKTNSYSDRLEVWRSTPEHLRHNDGWIFHHPTIADDDWMRYDWWNRCQEIDLTDIEDYQEWSIEKAIEFNTGCMDSGVWGFTFDW